LYPPRGWFEAKAKGRSALAHHLLKTDEEAEERLNGMLVGHSACNLILRRITVKRFPLISKLKIYLRIPTFA
jgi:hypothetical protein